MPSEPSIELPDQPVQAESTTTTAGITGAGTSSHSERYRWYVSDEEE